MQFIWNTDTIWMQSSCNYYAIRCILDVIQMQNLDAIVTESEMYLITSKLDQNINQKPDQQINNQIKTRYNLDAMVCECYIHLISSKLNLNINQKLDQQIKSWMQSRCDSN